MIKDSLYQLMNIEKLDSSYTAEIELLPESIIYRAHFECMPITPGVCLVQIAVDIIEAIEGCAKNLVEAKDIKFISIVSPNDCTNLRYFLSENSQEKGKWSICVYADESVCAKMSITVCNA